MLCHFFCVELGICKWYWKAAGLWFHRRALGVVENIDLSIIWVITLLLVIMKTWELMLKLKKSLITISNLTCYNFYGRAEQISYIQVYS